MNKFAMTSVLLVLAATLSACGHKKVAVDESPSVSALHKADECPSVSGQWDYEYTARDGNRQVSKDIYFTYTFQGLISYYDSTEGESWLVNGIETPLESGKRVLGYCEAGLIHFDVHDTDGKLTQIAIAISDNTKVGQLRTTDGAVTTQASLTKVIVEEKAHRPNQIGPQVGITNAQ